MSGRLVDARFVVAVVVEAVVALVFDESAVEPLSVFGLLKCGFASAVPVPTVIASVAAAAAIPAKPTTFVRFARPSDLASCRPTVTILPVFARVKVPSWYQPYRSTRIETATLGEFNVARR